jgi:uncharacterized membrane protein YbhN (UPF0104 family)
LPARTRRWRKLLGRALLVSFLVVVVGLLVWQARQIAWADVWSALRETPVHVLLAASLAAFCGHLVYSTFDLVGRRYTQHQLPTLPIQGVTFTSYAFPVAAVAKPCLIPLVVGPRNPRATAEKFRHRTTILILL